MGWRDEGEALARARAKYDKENTKQFSIKLNIKTDQDIIRWLWAQPNKQGAVKALIRDAIARKKEKS